MNPNLATPRRKSGWPIAFTLVLLIVAALAAFIFWRIETWPARTAILGTAELERLGRDVRDAFVDIAHLQPRVIINDRVYFEKTTPTAELSVISRRTEVEHELLHTWAGSTKRVKLHGTYIAKAGFDLTQDFSVQVQPDVIVVLLPHAKILGIEQEQVDVLAFENGLWNRISAEDLQSELSTLPQLARQRAAEIGLPAEAERSLRQQLEARVHAAVPLQILFTENSPKQ